MNISKDLITVKLIKDKDNSSKVVLTLSSDTTQEIKEAIRQSVTIKLEYPNLHTLDGILNKFTDGSCSEIFRFMLGFMGEVQVGILQYHDGIKIQRRMVKEEDIVLENFDFLSESVSISKPSDCRLDDFQIDHDTNDEPNADMTEVSTFVFDTVAFKEFATSVIDAWDSSVGKKEMKKTKLKSLEVLLKRTLENKSEHNTKSNKKALGYLMKSPKQLKLAFADHLLVDYK